MIDLIVIFFLLICSAFFSGSETSLTAISRAVIYRLVKKGDKRAAIVSRLRERKEDLISAILLGNNLVNIAATAIATSLAIHVFGDEGVFIVTIALTLIVLIFAEILPKTIALKHSESFALMVAPIISPIVFILTPFTRLIQLFIKRSLSILGVDISESPNNSVKSADVIRGTIELHHKDGGVVKHDKDMLRSILDLAEVAVGEIMEHRKHVETIDFEQPAQDIIHQAIHYTHSRLPVWKGNPDNIVGVLYMRDLMKLLEKYDAKQITHKMLEDIIHEPWFIPETTTLRAQLLAFRDRRKYFAHVVDEYGDFQGIVTLQDIIEEIVGEIRDEHEPRLSDNSDIVELENGAYSVKGMVTIRDLNRYLDWELPDEYASTVAGLVIHESRSIPPIGAVLSFHGYRFKITDKKDNQILMLEIKKEEE